MLQFSIMFPGEKETAYAFLNVSSPGVRACVFQTMLARECGEM